MANAHLRTKFQIECDQTLVTELKLKKLKERDILLRMNTDRDPAQGKYSDEMLKYDVKKVRTKWLAQREFNFDRAVDREEDSLDLLEQTYWKAYELSKRGRVVTRDSTGRLKPGEKLELDQRQTVTESDGPGDPRFLAGVQTCIAMRCRLRRLVDSGPLQLAPDAPPPTNTGDRAAYVVMPAMAAPMPPPTDVQATVVPG